MGHPATHEQGWQAGQASCGFPGTFFSIPAPMAAFGIVIAFMFGAMMGAMMSKKHSAMMGGGMMGPGMMGGAMPWKRFGMHGHHHHGQGAPACTQWHKESPSEGKAADSEA